MAMVEISMETTAGGDGRGYASGWAVRQPADAEYWRWSAYGPGGHIVGIAPTKAAAERRAQDEAEKLKR